VRNCKVKHTGKSVGIFHLSGDNHAAMEMKVVVLARWTLNCVVELMDRQASLSDLVILVNVWADTQ